MYGLVNRGIEDMVTQQFGREAWKSIKRDAGVEVDVFVRMEAYPDELTYNLVGSASRILELPVPDILDGFGRFWTQYTGREGYGEFLEAAGSSLWEFLHNLDELHSRVGLIYPKLTPPSFSCSEVTEQSLVLHYYSQREGLAPMVIGLLQGLSLMFDTPVTIEHLQQRAAGADHDAFRITKQPAD